MTAATSRAERLLLATAGSALLAFLVAPLLALVLTGSLHGFASGLRSPLVWPALRLSLFTTSLSLGLTVALGTPLAWVLARAEERWIAALETLVQVPMVMPPAVAGVALLLSFGRRGGLSGWAYPEGFSFSFTTAAVVMAELFVSAPFYVQAATAAFRRVDPALLVVAQSFGARPLRIFLRVGVPIAGPGLVAGAAMAWARSLGEFGATLMFAGNLEGKTQTLPLAIYTALESDFDTAQALSIVLVTVALVLLLTVRAVHHASGRAERA